MFLVSVGAGQVQFLGDVAAIRWEEFTDWYCFDLYLKKFEGKAEVSGRVILSECQAMAYRANTAFNRYKKPRNLINLCGSSIIPNFCSLGGGVRGTVIARWTAGQQVERSILQRGISHNKIPPIIPGCPRPSVAESWPRTPVISFHFCSQVSL